jgi:hypothetical protein|tara:strand:- start:27994 stop:29217 length:1224 start_codon:yes stop_codon:yes gene_type:complete
MSDQPEPAEPHYLTLPEWPKLKFGEEEVDGLVPVCRVLSWRHFEAALADEFLNMPGTEFIYRGQRRHEWQLTPTLGRYSAAGVVEKKRAEEQKREFRLAMRGRGIDPNLLDEDHELWAFGQHHGLATPLLDWTKSPFVALFFAFADPDFSYEASNPSRTIFVINKTALEELDQELIVQPLRNDHTRLVNQAGLFTISPQGSDTLATRIFNLLAETQTVDMDDPEAIGRFIFKIHIPNEERAECLNMLRKMNIHHGSLFPDPIGASLYCNEWFGGRQDGPVAPPTRAPARPMPKRPAKVRPVGRAPSSVGRPANMRTSVARVLRTAGVDKELASLLAKALVAKFHSTAPIDWTNRAFGSATVSVEIKRILRMNGVEKERVDPVALAVFEYFAGQSAERASDKTAESSP